MSPEGILDDYARKDDSFICDTSARRKEGYSGDRVVGFAWLLWRFPWPSPDLMNRVRVEGREMDVRLYRGWARPCRCSVRTCSAPLRDAACLLISSLMSSHRVPVVPGYSSAGNGLCLTIGPFFPHSWLFIGVVAEGLRWIVTHEISLFFCFLFLFC